ncbi:flagellin [Fusibacter sp. 3D3]|uniref:flagellin n=1 Tax=Fusibacter sp. 3D3 TaxID=1048380 RepID=UPI00085337CB|nr:flagellin [Fusibacter sp. 3D3]GAU77009.1 flagellin protein FlaA [Fusibacter sp. 3D3]
MKIDSNSFNPMIQGAQNKPANISIEQKMTSQINALNQGSENAQTVVDALKTADGALQSVSDPLQEIKQLAIQAQNGILTVDDKNAIQSQIEGLKSSIKDTLKNTEFNTIKLLGQDRKLNVQTGNQGTSMQLQNTSLESLGISDFNVTGDFDLSKIDQALEKVSAARSKMGSKTTGLESTVRSNDIAQENTVASRANLEEDLLTQISDFKKQDYLKQYQLSTQKLQMESQKSKLNILA